MDDHKRSVYTQGTSRKSKREKEKEAAEAKRKEEEEHAAKAYAEFLDAFQGEGSDRKKSASTFVKAGHGSGSAYTPAVKPKASVSRAFDDSSMVRGLRACSMGTVGLSFTLAAPIPASGTAQTQRETCYGLVLGGDKEVRIIL